MRIVRHFWGLLSGIAVVISIPGIPADVAVWSSWLQRAAPFLKNPTLQGFVLGVGSSSLALYLFSCRHEIATLIGRRRGQPTPENRLDQKLRDLKEVREAHTEFSVDLARGFYRLFTPQAYLDSKDQQSGPEEEEEQRK